MRHGLILCSCFAWCALLGLAISRALAGELPADVADQYGPAAQKLERSYTNATIEGKYTREYPQTKKSLTQNFAFRSAGTKARLDVTTLSDKGLGSQIGRKRMYMVTPYGSLDTVEGPKSPAFDDAREDTYKAARAKMEEMCPLTYPYSFDTKGTFYDMLQSSQVKIMKVENIKRNNERFVLIQYTQQVEKKEARESWTGSLLLSPSEGWALRQFSRTTGQGKDQVTLRGSLSYSGTKDDVPLLSSIECREDHGAGGQAAKQESVTVSRFQLGAASDWYFTSDAFSPTN